MVCARAHVSLPLFSYSNVMSRWEVNLSLCVLVRASWKRFSYQGETAEQSSPDRKSHRLLVS
jgi:hypothetical protein